jgi:hypothetical protein
MPEKQGGQALFESKGWKNRTGMFIQFQITYYMRDRFQKLAGYQIPVIFRRPVNNKGTGRIKLYPGEGEQIPASGDLFSPGRRAIISL